MTTSPRATTGGRMKRIPNGPYVRRDGFTNPANFDDHRKAMVRLSLIVPALAAAWELTGEKKYADHAGLHLRAWFVDPATKMNADLEYAQAIFNLNNGRGIGIIDTLHLVEPARAATVLANGGVLEGAAAIKDWFSQYLDWMRTSKNGQEERDAKNNHGSCWVMQAAEFGRFTGNVEVMTWCRERFKTVLVPDQSGSGWQPASGTGADEALQLLPFRSRRDEHDLPDPLDRERQRVEPSQLRTDAACARSWPSCTRSLRTKACGPISTTWNTSTTFPYGSRACSLPAWLMGKTTTSRCGSR